MTKRPHNERNSSYWTECGLPMAIAECLSSRADSDVENKDPFLERARRFRRYWEKNPDDEKPAKYWRRIEKNAFESSPDPQGYKFSQADSLVSIFLTWPDEAVRHPYATLYGERKKGLLVLTVEQERRHYAEMANTVNKVSRFLSPHQSPDHFENLMRDAQATGGDAIISCMKLREVNSTLRMALIHLERTMRLVDPGAKYPTGQPDGADAEKKSYIAVLASLNQKLVKPQNTAIAYLAKINNPNTPVTADAIRVAWRDNPKTKQ